MEILEIMNKCKVLEESIGLHDVDSVKNSTKNIDLATIQNELMQLNKSLILCQESVDKSDEINLTKKFDDIYKNLNYQNTSQEPDESNADELDWTSLLLVALFCILIVVTIIGNTLVILSVCTTKRLRTVTNCFVMSLAVADWLVGIFVMPPAVAYFLMGSWHLGWVLCDIWISLDVLLCTASILSLCAISIDRYLAVTQPLNYSKRRRSKRLALLMIFIVWVLALAITCPPILGWYEPGRRNLMECRYNQNEGYVVFSAMGSFFIPMIVMVYVYARISCVVASRHDQMSEIKVHQKSTRMKEEECDFDSESEHKTIQIRKRFSDQMLSSTTKGNISFANDIKENYYGDTLECSAHNKNGHYELVDINNPLPSNLKRNATITYKLSTFRSQWSNESIDIHDTKNKSTAINQPQPSMQYSSRVSRAHQKSLSTRISSLKRESKTTQTLSIVVGGFILCWLPFFIYYIIIPFLPSEYISSTLQLCLTWLGWINSAINPFIYAFYSVDFRAAFWRLTLRRFFKNSQPNSYTSTMFSSKR